MVPEEIRKAIRVHVPKRRRASDELQEDQDIRPGTFFNAISKDGFSRYQNEYGDLVPSFPIGVLDPCNSRLYWDAEAWLAGKLLIQPFHIYQHAASEGFVKESKQRSLGKFVEECKQLTRSNAHELRVTHPDHIPVILLKHPRSGLRIVGHTRYRVNGKMRLEEFVDFCVRRPTRYHGTLTVSFKNTTPPTDALMCEIDEDNKDEDGFLRLIYNGEKRKPVWVGGPSEVIAKVEKWYQDESSGSEMKSSGD